MGVATAAFFHYNIEKTEEIEKWRRFMWRRMP